MIFRDIENIQNRECFGVRMLNGSVFGYFRKEVPNWFYSWAAVESVI